MIIKAERKNSNAIKILKFIEENVIIHKKS